MRLEIQSRLRQLALTRRKLRLCNERHSALVRYLQECDSAMECELLDHLPDEIMPALIVSPSRSPFPPDSPD